MPVQNGAVNTCRPNGIFYTKVKHTKEIDANHSVVIQSFIRLPVLDHVVNNAAGTAKTITTFSGPSDWNTPAQLANYQALIYNHIDAEPRPFNLKLPGLRIHTQ